MVLDREEFVLARMHAAETPFPALSPDQLKTIKERGNELFRWYKTHPRLHIFFNLSVLAGIFVAEYCVLLRLPGLLLPSMGLVLAGLFCGALHSWLMYSLVAFSIHEGAAHKLIFPSRGRATNAMGIVANNLSRLGGADPQHYSLDHASHHSKFGTDEDGEFLSFVRPRRLWLSLLPYAFALNYTTFVAHRPREYTKSHILSIVIAASYHLGWAYLMARRYGWLLPAVAFGVIAPHFGFWLERLRQFSEHNLMPLNNNAGARSLGLGFWGMLVGGGPWGQPCHWEHHLVPNLPWYQQLALHRFVARRLSSVQKKQFLITPVVGFPRLLWRLVRDTTRFAREHPLDPDPRAS